MKTNYEFPELDNLNATNIELHGFDRAMYIAEDKWSGVERDVSDEIEKMIELNENKGESIWK